MPAIVRLTALAGAVLLAAACGEERDGAHAADAAPPAVEFPAVGPQAASADPVVHVYKTPTCGCCTDWVDHAAAAGFRTEAVDLPDLSLVKARYGVPAHLASCHTSVVDGYVIEGHVPAEVVARLLEERPDIRGIAVPGMPIGSPGMEVPGRPADPYDVVAFDADGGEYVFESR